MLLPWYLHKCSKNFRAFGLFPIVLIAGVAQAQVSGYVFRDYNGNGVRDSADGFSEPLIGGVTVKAYPTAGAVQTTVSAVGTGAYAFPALSLPARIEFSDLPAGEYDTQGGGTNVQFYSAATTEANYGLASPADYYSSPTPTLLSSLFVNGDQTSGTERTLLSFPYTASTDDSQAQVTAQALDNQIGSVYGLAYQRSTQRIFASAYLRRHSGLGPGGLDAIYVTAKDSNNPSLFVKLADLGIDVGSVSSNAARGLAGVAEPSYDPEGYNLVGKVGIGDLDISADDKTLYLVNLYDKKVYGITIDADSNPATPPTVADVTSYPLPTPTRCIQSTPTAIRVNLGGNRYVDSSSRVWMNSAYHFSGQKGSTTDSVDVTAAGAADETIYQSFWDWLSALRIPIANGNYTVRLHYVDFWGSPTGRNFNVSFENGQIVVSKFNIYNEAGGNGKAVVKSYNVSVTDNQLDIEFNSDEGHSAILAGIEVLGQTSAIAGQWRPFGLGINHNSVFVGGVCDGATSQTATDLKALVYQLNPLTGITQPVLEVPLDYQKGYAYNVCQGQFGWFAWLPDNLYPGACDDSGTIAAYPQPMLTDIAFGADDALLLGLRDRFGDQTGNNNYTLSGTALRNGTTAGDVLRAAWANDHYELEQNASVGGLTTAGANNAQGPGGGEFYFQDNYTTGHQDTSLGSLAVHKGFERLLHTRIDLDYILTGGVAWLSNQTGERVQGYTLYDQQTKFMGKAAGLGDLELALEPSPIEIGNRIWLDSNSNGIQDADEAGLDGVDVTLQCGLDSATTTTSNGGQYYFSTLGKASFMEAGESCVIRVANTQASIQNYFVTLTNGDGISNNAPLTDIRDSDAVVNGSAAEISFTVGSGGENNHGLDIGYSPTPIPATCKVIVNQAAIVQADTTDPVLTNNSGSAFVQVGCEALITDLKLEKVVVPTTAHRGDTVTYTLTLTNESSTAATQVQVQDVLPASLNLVSSNASQGSYANGVWEVGELAAGQVVTLTLTVSVN